jgi:hypothetical protein
MVLVATDGTVRRLIRRDREGRQMRQHFLRIAALIVGVGLTTWGCEESSRPDDWEFEGGGTSVDVHADRSASDGSESGPEVVCPEDYMNAGDRPEWLSDPDDDHIPAINDNCPGVENPEQRDRDGDGIGDACDRNPESACRNCAAIGASCESAEDCCAPPRKGRCRTGKCRPVCSTIGVVCHSEHSPCCGGNCPDGVRQCLE